MHEMEAKLDACATQLEDGNDDDCNRIYRYLLNHGWSPTDVRTASIALRRALEDKFDIQFEEDEFNNFSIINIKNIVLEIEGKLKASA